MKHVKTMTRPGVLRAQAAPTDKIQLIVSILGALATIIPLIPEKPATTD